MQKGPNARAEVKVTLEEMYNGGTHHMDIKRNIYCSQCRGTGAKDGKTTTCNKCQGKGVVMQRVTMGFGM